MFLKDDDKDDFRFEEKCLFWGGVKVCDFFFEFFLSLFSLSLLNESWHLQSILKEERGDKDPPFWTKKTRSVLKKTNEQRTRVCVFIFTERRRRRRRR